MILHMYFARRFAMTFLLITGVLFTLVVLLDAVEQARSFARFGVSAGEVIQLALLNAPQTINLILPLIVILATLALFL